MLIWICVLRGVEAVCRYGSFGNELFVSGDGGIAVEVGQVFRATERVLSGRQLLSAHDGHHTVVMT